MFSADGLRYRRGWVLALFTLALVLQLAVLRATFPGNDAVYYYDDAKIALNLIGGQGYSVSYEYRNWFFYEVVLKTATLQDPITDGTKATAIKQPAYALFLAALFYCFGAKNFLVVFLIHAVISAVTVSLLFLFLREAAPFAALAVALGATMYPAFVIHSATIPESTALLLALIAAIWLWVVKIRQRASASLWVKGGALGGLAALTDPVTLPFVGICFCYGVGLDHRDLRKRLAGGAIAGAVTLLVLAPWFARNYIVFDRFPVFKSGLGQTFNWGLHFSGKGSWIPEERIVALEKAGRSLSELEEDEAMRRELLALFPSHWREYVTYDIPHHVLHLWWDVPRYWDDYSLRYMLGRRLPYLCLLGLALPYLFRTAVRLVRQPRATLQNDLSRVSALILIVTYTVVYGLFGAFHSRYRLPVELGLFVFAGATVEPVVERIWNQWFARSTSLAKVFTQDLSRYGTVPGSDPKPLR
jgi:hypothetical protein